MSRVITEDTLLRMLRRYEERIAVLERQVANPINGMTKLGPFALNNPTAPTIYVWDNIPQNFSHLRVIGKAQGDTSYQYKAMRMRMNDGASAYQNNWTEQLGTGSHSSGQEANATSWRLGNVPGTLASNANYVSTYIVDLPFYSLATGVKTCYFNSIAHPTAGGGATSWVRYQGVSSEEFTSNAITKLTVFVDDVSALDPALTQFDLYAY